MTSRKFFESVIEGTITNEMVEFAKGEIEKLDNKNERKRESSKNNPTPYQQATEELKSNIKSSMESNKTYSANELAAMFSTTTQKISPIMKSLVDEGFVTVSELKFERHKAKGYTLA